jgi:hypothetical protein
VDEITAAKRPDQPGHPHGLLAPPRRPPGSVLAVRRRDRPAHLDAVTEHAAAPVIAKYTGVLGGADIEIFTRTTTFAIMQAIRLDRCPSGPVHP